MRLLTTINNQSTNKNQEQDQELQNLPNWRHAKLNTNRLVALTSSKSTYGDHAAPNTNNTALSNRFRVHNALSKFVQQSRDFARRR